MKYKTILLTGLFLILLSSFVLSDLTDGNVAYWSFDETNTNTQYANGITASTGKLDGALSFDGGNDYINVLDSNALDLTELTISGWINCSSGANDYIMFKGAYGTPINYALGVDASDYLYMNAYNPTDYLDIHSTATSGAICDGTYHFVAVSYGNAQTSVKFYIDGVNTENVSATMDLVTNAGELYFGGYNVGVDGINADLDDWAIYNRSLALSEIQSMYNAGTGTTAESVASDYVYYNSMDGLYDLSDNSKQLLGYQGVKQTPNSTGLLNSAFYFDGINHYLKLTNKELQIKSLSLWAKRISTKGDYDVITQFSSNDGNDVFSIQRSNANKVYVYYKSSGSIIFQNETIPYDDMIDWHNFILNVADDGNIYFYINGESYLTTTLSDYIDGTGNLTIGLDNNLINPSNVYVDEFSIWNKSLTPTEITQLYNSGEGYNPYSSIAGEITISSTLPETNTQFNTATININATLDASEVAIFNCSLYVNDEINYTWTNQANTTTFLGTDITFDTDSTNTYYFNCTDGTTETTSSTKTFYIDIIDPAITTSFTSGKIVFNSNLTGQFNFSDSFLLFSYNISVDGTSIDSATDLNTSSYVYNLSYNPSALAVGTHNLSVRIADGHTSNAIPEYNISDGIFNNFLNFETKNNRIAITSETNSIFDKFSYKKERDRYTFDYTPSEKKKTTYKFVVTAEEPFHIIDGGEKYKEYLISGNNWIDFVSPNNKNSKVKIKLITPTEAEVTISGINNADKIEFTSIGELNIIEQNFTFGVGNYTFSYPATSQEGSAENYILTINAPNVTGITSTFNYNNTLYALTGTTTTAERKIMNVLITTPFINNISYVTPMYWTINNNGYYFNTSVYNQTYNPSELSINVYDEANQEYLNSSSLILSTATTSLTNSTTNGTFYFNNLEAGEYSVKLSSTGYSSRTYLVTIGNGTTQYLNAYLTNSSASTIISVTDYDSGEVVTGASASMYIFLNNSWVPVESKYTDVSGKVQFYYIADTKYKFYFYKDLYEDNIFYLDPVLYDTYSIKLKRETIVDYAQDYDGIGIMYGPTTFYNGEVNDFSILISSPSGSLINYGVNLTYPGGTTSYNGTNAIGEHIDLELNITGANALDVVKLDYYYTTSISGTRYFTNSFSIIVNNSVNTFMSNNDNTYGLTTFERIFICTIGILLIVGISALIGALIPGLFLGLFIFGYMVFTGFIPIWSIVPSVFIGILYISWKSGG